MIRVSPLHIFFWKRYTPEINQIKKLKFLGTNSNGCAAARRAEAAARQQGRSKCGWEKNLGPNSWSLSIWESWILYR